MRTDPTQQRVQRMAFQLVRSRLSSFQVLRQGDWSDQHMQLVAMLMMNVMKIDWLLNHSVSARKLSRAFCKLTQKQPELAGDLAAAVIAVAEGKKVSQVLADYPVAGSLPKRSLEELELAPVDEWPSYDDWVKIAEQHIATHRLSDGGRYPTLDMFSNAVVHLMTHAKGRFYHFGMPVGSNPTTAIGDNRGYVPARAFFSTKDVMLVGESSVRGRRAEFRHRTTPFGSDLSLNGFVDPYVLFWCLHYASIQRWRVGFFADRGYKFSIQGAAEMHPINDDMMTEVVTGVKMDIIRHPIFAVIRDATSAIVAATLQHAGFSVYDSSGLSLSEVCALYNVYIDSDIGSFTWNRPIVVCWRPELVENENVSILTDDRSLTDEQEVREANDLADLMMEVAYGREVR